MTKNNQPANHEFEHERPSDDEDSENDSSGSNVKEFEPDDLATPGSPPADETEEDPSDWTN